MKVTIKDVAKEANVAVSTVSRVLSNSGKISEKTKEKVWAVVKKLNYVPNDMARSFATKRTKILAVIMPQWVSDSFYHPFFLQIFKGISNCAKDRGFFIMYAFKENDDTTSKVSKPQNAAMLIIIIFLVIVLLGAIGFVVLYKLGIIKLKNLKF